MSGEVVFSGMRPTGKLQLGNYWGALKNWITLTEDHACYFSVVDYHMLTTGYEDTSKLQENIRDMVLDWLAAGLDPKKCVIFKQSDVHEHAELALILGMVTPISWLENNPTWKEQIQELSKSKMTRTMESVPKNPDDKAAAAASEKTKPHISETDIDLSLRTFGFLGYPVLQAADILLYRGTRVPVGQDQLPHIELSREIARRFNSNFGEVFPEPRPILTPTPKVPGLDGRKMSKSYGNTMDLHESRESLKTKVLSMYTDPTREKKTSPGHPEPCAENPPGCSVFALHKLYSDGSFVEKRGEECRGGQVGCVACKKDLLASLEKPFSVFRVAREKLKADKGLVDAILEDGARRARAAARETMKDVRRAMRL